MPILIITLFFHPDADTANLVITQVVHRFIIDVADRNQVHLDCYLVWNSVLFDRVRA